MDKKNKFKMLEVVVSDQAPRKLDEEQKQSNKLPLKYEENLDIFVSKSKDKPQKDVI